jgi:FKBP-type peptidyl-prolyl cis-trans isomerase (trigger factor)
MDLLRQSIRRELEKTAAESAQAKLEAELVDKIVSASKIDYPSLLLDQEVGEEVQSLLADLKKRQVQVEDYLAQIGKTPDELTSEISARSDLRIRRGLLLGDIARKEGLLITDADVASEIAARAADAGTSPEAMRAYIDANKQLEVVRNTALTKKVVAFLTSSAIITDKSLEETKLAEPDMEATPLLTEELVETP